MNEEMNSMEDTVDNNLTQPIMLDVVSDARMGLEKVAEMLSKIDGGLTDGEILQLKPELEGIAYSAAIILMTAEISREGGK